MTSIRQTLLFVSSVIVLSLIVFPVFAQVIPISGPCTFLGTGNCSGGETFGTTIQPTVVVIINIVIGLIGTLAAAFLVVAAIQYVTSQGDAEKAEKAKRGVVYAILGLILALGAWIIVNAVIAINPLPIDILITNYINMALTLFGLIAAIYIIYAGYKYITSQGDEEAAVTAKRQIVLALIGVFIAGAAQIIINVVQIQDATLLIVSIRSIINAVLTILGLIAAAYVILGGVMYFMSQGDQDKSLRARMQIFYALLGIAVISVSAILVNFIIANI